MDSRIIQHGFGGVGQALVQQYLSLAERYPWLGYVAISDRSGLCYVENGWTKDDLLDALAAKTQGQTLAQFASTSGKWDYYKLTHNSTSGLPSLDRVLPTLNDSKIQNPKSKIVVDVTAERAAYDTMLTARQRGAHIVMCNKWALAENTDRYEALLSAGTGVMLYETTVGAALPVINTLDRLLQSGDEVYKIEAAISGTLGYVCSEIQYGTPFSEALLSANRLGYTEPDPRDDLAGVDARRKALILARKLGQRLDMDDVQVESLVPNGLESVSLDEFWRRLPQADAAYAKRVADTTARGNVLRFLARIDQSGCAVALTETPLNSLPGSLSGTESLFVFHTRRYGDQPLAVRGRGAGADVTASGVFADILSLMGHSQKT
jgi:homoserine dehydrogenase